ISLNAATCAHAATRQKINLDSEAKWSSEYGFAERHGNNNANRKQTLLLVRPSGVLMPTQKSHVFWLLGELHAGPLDAHKVWKAMPVNERVRMYANVNSNTPN